MRRASVRIKGLVKAFQVVRDQLQRGIPEAQVEWFRAYVENTIRDVEAICAEHGITPERLPAPSRNAYRFLKQLDLDRLPVLQEGDPVPGEPSRPLRIRNVVANGDRFAALLARRAAELETSPKAWLRVAAEIEEAVEQIERICREAGTSPAGLESRSRQAYQFMKFLTTKGQLSAHLRALQLAACCARQVRPAREMREIVVQLKVMRPVYRSHADQDAITIELHEGFLYADEEVLNAALRSILKGKTADDRRLITEYVESEAFGWVADELEAIAGDETLNGRGRVYDLDEVFDRVNHEYFGGVMEKPTCHWNRTPTMRKLGHYEPHRDRLMISVTLDDERVPAFVVEYVMYHELLHKKHGMQWSGGRRLAHTPAFRADERRFRRYQEAEEALHRLARQLHRR